MIDYGILATAARNFGATTKRASVNVALDNVGKRNRHEVSTHCVIEAAAQSR